MIVFHPLLLSLYPILFLYSVNLDRVGFSDIIGLLLISFFFSLGLFLFLTGLTKSKDKGALITTVLLIAFYSYGHVYESLLKLVGTNALEKIFLPRNLLIVWATFFLLFIFVVFRAKRSLLSLTKASNIIALVLVAITVATIGIKELRRDRVSGFVEGAISGNIDLGSTESRGLPDIYYIVLDSYASSDTLREIYGFDNSEFEKYLEDEDFFIAEKSTSNYVVTSLSLASTLNMKYVNELSDVVGEESRDVSVLYRMIEDSELVRYLKKKGYRYIHFSSGWGPTNYANNADVNFQKVFLNEFTTILLRSTLLGPIEFIRPLMRERIIFTFDKLKSVNQIEGRKFVFAHILLPHPPWLFGRDGENVSGSEIALAGDTWQEKDEYIDQVIFANKKVKEVVDVLTSRKQRPVVIILQGDHGPSSTNEGQGEKHYKEKTKIFNAYYTPELDESRWYDSITPVNTFRVILTNYLAGDYPLLLDKNYFTPIGMPYKFKDVTRKVQSDY